MQLFSEIGATERGPDEAGIDEKTDDATGSAYHLLGDGSSTDAQSISSVIEANGVSNILVGGNGLSRVHGSADADLIVGGGVISEALQDGYGYISEYMESGQDYLGASPHRPSLADTLVGGAGDDLIIGGGWYDTNGDGVFSADELVLDGNPVSNDPLYDPVTYPLDQMVFSLGFNNIAWAGDGDDTVYGADGFDTLGGGEGNDVLYGYGSADVIYGGAGDDMLNGNSGADVLYGGAGDDIIYGEDGPDRIYGGNGADHIFGGQGDDSLSGGAGADSFTFSNDSGHDIIVDFDVTEDALYFDNIQQQILVDELLAHADEQTVDGDDGLMIYLLGGQTIFLAGLGYDDVGSINAYAGSADI